MKDTPEYSEDARKLESWLAEAKYKAHAVAPGVYLLMFDGEFRGWNIQIRCGGGLICWSLYLMRIPTNTPRRLRFLEYVCELNDRFSLAKLAKFNDTLTLDMECPSGEINAEKLRSYTAHLYKYAEEHYAGLFRIATGDCALKELETAFNRPTLTEGAE